MFHIIGNIVVIIGLIFMAIGVIGLYRFDGFYEKILVSSKIDTAGFMTILIGIMIISGFNLFTVRVLLLLVIVMLLGPISTHVIARSAYHNDDEKKDGES